MAARAAERMTRRLSPIAVALLIIAAVCSIAYAWLLFLNEQSVDSFWQAASEVSGAIPFALVGLIVTRAQRQNPVGWLMLVLGMSLAVVPWGFEYALRSSTAEPLPFADLAAYVSQFVRPLLLGSASAIAFLFPSGRISSRPWLVALWALVVVTGLGMLVSLGETPAVGDPSVEVASPLITISDDTMEVLEGLLWLSSWVLVAFGAGRLISLFFRGSGVERLQMRWLASVIVLGFALLGISALPIEALNGLNELAGTVILVGVPVAIGVAITRYRLYDIDRIISRTVSYALVVGLLVAVFFGLATAVTALLPADSSDLAVAGSTLAVAALFNPLRKRVQGWVDRRFNRSRYDAERVIEKFTGTLRDRVDPDGVVDGWVGVVTETMQPSAVSVWVRESS